MIEEEYGSCIPVRFIVKQGPFETESKLLTDSWNINLSEKTSECLDCDAKSLAFQLKKINFDDPDLDLINSMKKIKESLLFILWNTDWPVGD